MTDLVRILRDAKRLAENGPQSMYPEDEARHLAQATLGLLIETLEAITSKVADAAGQPTSPQGILEN